MQDSASEPVPEKNIRSLYIFGGIIQHL